MKVTRKRLLYAFVVLVGLLLIGTELYILNPSVRLMFLVLADEVGASDAMVHFLGDEDRDVLSTAYKRLTDRGARSTAALVRGLDHKDVLVRRRAAAILGDLAPPQTEALDAMRLHMLNDPDEFTRSSCARSIGRIGRGNPAVAAETIKMMENDSEEAQIRGIEILASGPPDVAGPRLEKALNSDNPRIKQAASKALGID